MAVQASDDLLAVKTKISGELSRRPEYLVTQPREVRVLHELTLHELEEFARAHGWRVISRVGGRQYQFYNDTYARTRNAE
ncbi:MAG: hypothetical protein M3R10_01210, partial [Verrucomicrobiota bacterium]|nr:hypothetical protein [Verrucomicrobiota bacterium]